MWWSSLSVFIPAINIWSLAAMAKGSIAIKNKRGDKGLIGHIFLHLSLGLPGFGSSVIRAPLKVGGSIPFWKDSENMYRKGCVNLVANFIDVYWKTIRPRSFDRLHITYCLWDFTLIHSCTQFYTVLLLNFNEDWYYLKNNFGLYVLGLSQSYIIWHNILEMFHLF